MYNITLYSFKSFAIFELNVDRILSYLNRNTPYSLLEGLLTILILHPPFLSLFISNDPSMEVNSYGSCLKTIPDDSIFVYPHMHSLSIWRYSHTIISLCLCNWVSCLQQHQCDPLYRNVMAVKEHDLLNVMLKAQILTTPSNNITQKAMLGQRPTLNSYTQSWQK